MTTLQNDQYLPSDIRATFHDLDGADIAAWLTLQGYDVLYHKDSKLNAIAVTACGFTVSSNGYMTNQLPIEGV